MRLGIDLGWTKIEGAILDRDDEIVLRRRVATPQNDYAAICAAIGALIEALEAAVQARCSVGTGIPGAISPTTRLVKNANTVCLIGKPFVADLMRRLGRSARAANDANCFVLSEAVDGAARGCANVFDVIVGTGTGGGLHVNGALFAGASAIAGEWGHNSLPWARANERGRACYCGKRDCIEIYLCSKGLALTYADRSGRPQFEPKAIAGDGDARDALAA